MSAYDYNTFKSILFEATYSSDASRAALTNLKRLDADGDPTNGYQITFSFMDKVPDYFSGSMWGIQGFSSATDALKTVIRTILGNIDINTNIDFVEVSNSHYATMRFGMYTTRNGLPATSNDAEGFTGGLYAYKPTTTTWADYTGADGEIAGDAFFTQSVINKGLSPSQSGYAIVLHELLHCLGFKHPFSPFPTLSSNLDNTDYTVMSYNGDYSFTQPSILDIDALHYLYGKPTGLGDDEWRSGSNMTVNNTFTGGNGKSIDGGSGTDTVVYSGFRTEYTLTKTTSGYTVKGCNGATDTLFDIERIQFADRKIAVDLSKDGDTGKALEFIGTVAYNLTNNPGAVGSIQGLFDAGYSMSQVCQLAISLGLIKNLAGSSSNIDLVKLVCQNVLGATPDVATTDALIGYMDGRAASFSQADFLAAVAGLLVNDAHINLVGLAQTGVEYA